MGSAKKEGAGAAALNRADVSQTQEELIAELNRLQDTLEKIFAEHDRYAAKIECIRKYHPIPETDVKRRIDAYAAMLRSLNSNRNVHYLQGASILYGLGKSRAAGELSRIIYQTGLFGWFFMDRKQNWYMRRKSGLWVRVRWGRISKEMQSMGISNRKESRGGLSPLQIIRLAFNMNEIELTNEVETALMAGEKMSIFDIITRCSYSFIWRVRGMETMNREFGDSEGWRF